tara:strand:- start:804 stop:1028 length:225 start_codon:yes stop_codon:yes gene_type:complete
MVSVVVRGQRGQYDPASIYKKMDEKTFIILTASSRSRRLRGTFDSMRVKDPEIYKNTQQRLLKKLKERRDKKEE